jgi:hypothetical protein
VATGRNTNGTFGPGNPGGPGRPRRAVEREYLSALAEAVALEDWRQIVARAVQDAKAGDARAREWLSKHLMGDDPLALAELADELERVKAMLGVSHDTGGDPARLGRTAADGSGGGDAFADPSSGG